MNQQLPMPTILADCATGTFSFYHLSNKTIRYGNGLRVRALYGSVLMICF
jgi:hypothetical protein